MDFITCLDGHGAVRQTEAAYWVPWRSWCWDLLGISWGFHHEIWGFLVGFIVGINGDLTDLTWFGCI